MSSREQQRQHIFQSCFHEEAFLSTHKLSLPLFWHEHCVWTRYRYQALSSFRNFRGSVAHLLLTWFDYAYVKSKYTLQFNVVRLYLIINQFNSLFFCKHCGSSTKNDVSQKLSNMACLITFWSKNIHTFTLIVPLQSSGSSSDVLNSSTELIILTLLWAEPTQTQSSFESINVL